MKKYIALAIVILVVIGFFIVKKSNQPKVELTTTPTAKITYNLPDSWDKIDADKVDLKLEKKVDKGLKPQIVFNKTTRVDAKTPQKYVDRLISGARSALPSLRIVSDKRTSEENQYLAVLSGYYYNQQQKVSLMQRVYVQGENVSILTASYEGEMAHEINQIFDSIAKEKI